MLSQDSLEIMEGFWKLLKSNTPHAISLKIARRLMVLGLVMIVAGLALLVYADPDLNAVVIGQSTSTTSTTTSTAAVTSGLPGGFSGGFTISGAAGTGAGAATRSSSSSLSADSIAENSAGLALALVGLIIVVADSRLSRS